MSASDSGSSQHAADELRATEHQKLSKELLQKKQEACEQRKELMEAKRRYNNELPHLCQVERVSGESAMMYKTEIKRLKLDIIQQTHATTVKQRKTYRDLKKKLKSSNKTKKQVKRRRVELAKQIREVEQRLFDILFDIQTLDQQIGSKKAIPSKAAREDAENENDGTQSSDIPQHNTPDRASRAYNTEGNGFLNGQRAPVDDHDTLRNTTGYRQVIPESSEKATSYSPSPSASPRIQFTLENSDAHDHRSTCMCPDCIDQRGIPETREASKEPHSNSSPDHASHSETPFDILRSFQKLREQCRNVDINDVSNVQRLREAVGSVEIGALLAIPEVEQIVETLEKAEAEEDEAIKNYMQHRDTYHEQLEEYAKLHPGLAHDVCEERFGPEFYLRGHLAAKRLSQAKAAAKESRRKAYEIGIPNANGKYQVSGFHTVLGEELGEDDESYISIEPAKRKRIQHWLDAPEKKCKLDTEEGEHAFSGAHIEYWESGSILDRDPRSRRRIGRYGAGGGRVGGGGCRCSPFNGPSRAVSEPLLKVPSKEHGGAMIRWF